MPTQPVSPNVEMGNFNRRSTDKVRRIDRLGPLGLVIAVGGIVLGQVIEGGRVADVLQPTAALIVFGGTLGAVIVTTPASILKTALRRLKSTMFEETAPSGRVIELVVSLATKARKSGVVALEQEIRQIPDDFLRRGLMLAVDGEATNQIKEMLELDMKLEMSEANVDAKVLESAGGYAPTIGILGAVIGLIQVMKHLDNLSQVGSGIAVAFVATIYGVGSANLLFLPLGQKMRLRAWKTMRTKHLMLEGILAITEGLNPRLIRRRLNAFVGHEESRDRRQTQLESSPAKGTPA